ncbi:alpha-L-fucosidase [Microbacterium sp. AG1240]|uniref:alpha-L-fucosidase n=1 Tax=Microbacterium sp. AG1240 TaxID=2183992 RepID=UPI000EAC6E7D|nr:alpha-L-fucosidase [Microbacterium sp. AG1240]RKT31623.1 alpha-L-fucosidase [Microbacterium sp. AG1240]
MPTADDAVEKSRRHDHEWFDRSRFGMFIHWGPYSVAARHEQVMLREGIDPEEYERYGDYFDADLFDAEALADAAWRAGMRYAVLTAKHHDGYCLWPSALTDWSVARNLPGRDLVGEFVTAFRARGLRVGLYYSLLDWHHPDFTVDGVHPQRGGDVAALNASRDIDRYRRYLHGQVVELLTGYGTIDYLFFDFSYGEGRNGLPGKGAETWGSEDLLRTVRDLQPHILVNDRLEIPGDLVTPEQQMPAAADGTAQRWEVCQTISGSWGYDTTALTRRTSQQLLEQLVTATSQGGNMLLNVGPDARGRVDRAATDVLADLSEWFALHERTVRGAGPVAWQPPSGVVATGAGDRVWLHLLQWPHRHLILPGLRGRVRFARFVHDGSEVVRAAHRDPSALMNEHTVFRVPVGDEALVLPVVRPDVLLPVVELHLAPE